MIIVGLGNPSKEYENTFHNLGFMAIDKLAERLSKKLKKAECQALTAVFSYSGERIILAKPLTYMNLSGNSVKSLMTKYKETAENVIILYDDFDIPRFSLRAREKGSAGTHNGMKSIVLQLATTEFKRIRIGIGETLQEKTDFVLSKISKDELELFNKTLDILADNLIEYIAKKDFELLMRKMNGS